VIRNLYSSKESKEKKSSFRKFTRVRIKYITEDKHKQEAGGRIHHD
jgi:hypothetical protein